MPFRLLLLPLILLAFDRKAHLEQIQRTIAIYEERLACLQKHEAMECIQRHPLDPQGDGIARLFASSFPKAYYRAKLERDLQLLHQELLCYGRASSIEEARRCLKP
ncbi:MAG: hypothetical protein C6I00_04145 [Nitratiruptor sp.]|nr:hypothetical protein [Nitratiruptor sp.]NPA83976.1 hypothetical protein [Campylobacterota bacterium]